MTETYVEIIPAIGKWELAVPWSVNPEGVPKGFTYAHIVAWEIRRDKPNSPKVLPLSIDAEANAYCRGDPQTADWFLCGGPYDSDAKSYRYQGGGDFSHKSALEYLVERWHERRENTGSL
jgi:hypothetical protein